MITRRLTNGVIAAVVVLPGHPLGAVAVHVRAGRCYETPEEAGLAHLVEHLLFRGSARDHGHRAYSHACARLGADLNASSSYDEVLFHSSVLPDRARELVDTIGAAITSPRWTEAIVDAERRVVEQELSYYLDDKGPREPRHICLRDCVPGSYVDRDVCGSRASVAQLTLAHAKAHHARHYVGANMVVVVAGPYGDEAFGWIERAFGALPSGAPVEPIPPPCPVVRRPVMRTIRYPCDPQIRLVFEVPASVDELGVQLALTYLGTTSGPLYQTLAMDIGTTYNVHAGWTSALGERVIDVMADVRESEMSRALGAMTGVMARLALDGPPAEDLAWLAALHEWQLRQEITSAPRYAWKVGNALLTGRRLPDADSDLRRLTRLRPEHLRMLFRALSERMFVRAMCLPAATSTSSGDGEFEGRSSAAARSG